jgi:enoyl-CoA hydratase/carnithine racemase
LWSSRKVGAQEAYRIGLADRVLDQAALLPAVEAYVADLAATTAPRALATIKAQVYGQLSDSLQAAARKTDALLRESLTHSDAKEGAASFFERRAPKFATWTGAEG